MSFRLTPIFISGLIGGAAIMGAAAARARVEGTSPWRSINSTAHIFYGPKAARRRRPSFRYSGPAVGLNVAACLFWAAVYSSSRAAMAHPQTLASALITASGTSALAYVTDYYIVPRRFTPGFEMVLSRRSFPWLYAALAIGMMLPDAWASTRRRFDRA
jgi:threonine/homoserine efflux transporter RhtA